MTVQFAPWPIPAPHSTTCPCSSPSTGGSIHQSHHYIFYLPAPSHPPSPLQPPISLSSPQSSAAAAAPSSSHATSPTPSTSASKVTSPAVDPLHLSDHDLEPGHGVGSFPVAM